MTRSKNERNRRLMLIFAALGIFFMGLSFILNNKTSSTVVFSDGDFKDIMIEVDKDDYITKANERKSKDGGIIWVDISEFNGEKTAIYYVTKKVSNSKEVLREKLSPGDHKIEVFQNVISSFEVEAIETPNPYKVEVTIREDDEKGQLLDSFTIDVKKK